MILDQHIFNAISVEKQTHETFKNKYQKKRTCLVIEKSVWVKQSFAFFFKLGREAYKSTCRERREGGKLNFQEESKDRQLKGLKVSLIFLPGLERLCKKRAWQWGCGLKSIDNFILLKAKLQAEMRVLSNGATY